MNTTDPVTEIFGHVTVITWTDHEGISINVHTAGTRNSTLSAHYPHEDREQAKVWYRTIRDAAQAYTPVWLIEAQVSALIDAGQAVGANAELVAAINETMDAAKAKQDTDRAQLAADVAEIMGSGDGWYRMRHPNRPTIVPTRTNVHTKPLTPAEQALIRTHQDGKVTTRPGQSWLVLRAIVRRGYGTAVYAGKGQKITAVRLNARGLAAAETVGVAA